MDCQHRWSYRYTHQASGYVFRCRRCKTHTDIESVARDIATQLLTDRGKKTAHDVEWVLCEQHLGPMYGQEGPWWDVANRVHDFLVTATIRIEWESE